MKKAYILVLCLLVALLGGAQSRYGMPFDSIYLERPGGTTELILKNKTADRAGAFLRNRGGGRTEFAYVIDTAWATADSLYLRRGGVVQSFPKGGFSSRDTASINGTPPIASGNWTQTQLDSIRRKSDAKYLTSAQDYYEGGVKVGIKFTTDSVEYVIRFGSTGQPNYLRRIYAGYGETNVNDSTNAVDTSVIATKATLTQQVNILEAAKLNVNPAISGGTYLKITYDSKGLVTGGANATTSDVAEGSNLYYTAARARGAFSLNFTTTGTSGPASGGYDPATGLLSINVPQYQAGSSFGNQLANTIFGGPLTGAAASPSFRQFVAEYDLTGRLIYDPSNRATLKAIGNTTDTVVNFYRGDSLVSGLTSSGAWFNKFYVNGVLQNYYRYANSGNQIALQFYNKAFESRSEIKYTGDQGGYEFRTITGPGTPITRFAIFGSGESVFYNTTTVPKLRFTAVTSKSNIGTGDLVYHGIDNKVYAGIASEVHQVLTADASNTTYFPGAIVMAASNPTAAKLYVDGTAYFNATSGSNYGLIASGSTGTGGRAVFLAGKEGVTNGFSVDWNGSAMRYIFRDGKIGVGHLDPGSSIQVVGGVRADSLIGNNLTTGQVVIVGTNKELTNGGTLPGDNQTLSISGNSLSILRGNSVTLPTFTQQQVDWNATSGVTSIANKPTIPTQTSQLTNNSGFITISSVPTQTSQLTNNSGFVTQADVNGANKVLADANYTITATDNTIILPNPAAQRTLTLPAANTMQNKEITIVNWADATSDWVLSGSYIQKTTTGGFTSSKTEDFVGSGLLITSITLRSVNMTGTTWKWVQVQ